VGRKCRIRLPLAKIAFAALVLCVPDTRVAAADPPPPAAPASDEAEDPAELEGLSPFGVRALERRARDAGGGLPERLGMVSAGLDWLAAHQLSDGRWGPASVATCDGRTVPGRALTDGGKAWHEVGITALAVLAFLAAGHDHRDGGPHAPAVGRGLAWLVLQQDEEGCFGPRTHQHYVYDHGFAAQAVAEAYAVSGDAALLPPLQKGIDFTLRAQNPRGAWRYGVRPGDSDTSVTALMLMALCTAWALDEAAREAGRPAPVVLPMPRGPDDAAHPVARGLAWFDAMTDRSEGRVGYVERGVGPARTAEMLESFPGELSEALTAAALAARRMAPPEIARTPESAQWVEKGFLLLKQRPPVWDRKSGAIDLYYWYYGAVAVSLREGPDARAFEAALVAALRQGQRTDGDRCGDRGSWDPVDPWGPDGGRVYATSMAVLALSAPGWHVRRAPDTREITARLAAPGATEAERRRLLRTIAFHRLPGLEPAVLPWVRGKDADTCLAALRALAATNPTPEGTEALVQALADPDPRVREGASAAVGTLPRPPPQLLEPLRALLQQPEDAPRVAAAKAIARFGPEARPMLPELTALAALGSPSVRLAAARALLAIESGSAAAATVLLELLGHADPAVRREAARLVLSYEGPSDAFAAPLAAALGDADPATVGYAAVAAVRRGTSDPRIPALLLRSLEKGGPGLVVPALEGLARTGAAGAAATSQVAAHAHRGAREVRVAAARALAAIGGRPALSHLEALAGDPLPVVAQPAAAAVAALAVPPAEAAVEHAGRLASKDPHEAAGARAGLVRLGAQALPAVRTALRGSAAEPAAIRGALEVLDGMGAPAKEAAGDVAGALLAARDSGVAADLARALGALDVASVEVLEALEQTARGSSAAAVEAMNALGRLGAVSPEAVELVGRMLRDPKLPDANRPTLMAAVASSGANGAALLPLLFELFERKPEDPLRLAAVKALAGIGVHGMKEYRAHLKEGRNPTLLGVLQVLRAMGPAAAPALPELVERLKSPADSQSTATDDAISAIGDAAVKPVLRALPRMPKGREIRVVWILERLGPLAKEAVPTLEKLAKSSDRNVAQAAQKALLAVRGKP
jgi:hypothetical protein